VFLGRMDCQSRIDCCRIVDFHMLHRRAPRIHLICSLHCTMTKHLKVLALLLQHDCPMWRGPSHQLHRLLRGDGPSTDCLILCQNVDHMLVMFLPSKPYRCQLLIVLPISLLMPSDLSKSPPQYSPILDNPMHLLASRIHHRDQQNSRHRQQVMLGRCWG